jgi:hypothetical protein
LFLTLEKTKEMTTIVLEIKDKDKSLFMDLAKRLEAKIDIVTDELEDLGLSNTMLEGQKTGRMTDQESTLFLESLGE